MLTDILHNAETFNNQIALLKEKSPIFPKVYFEEKGGVIWATTMVVFSYNNDSYKRHHVESIIPTKHVGINQLYNKLYEAAEMTIALGKPCKFDEIIKEP